MDVVGAPDLVIEIVGFRSAERDLIDLAGITEDWLIDARTDGIDFRILTRGEHEYSRVEPDAEGYCLSQVLGAHFRLVRERSQFGRYRYKLPMR